MDSTITVTPVLNQEIRLPVPFKESDSKIMSETRESLDLSGTRDLMGKLWIPTYLPEGYQLCNIKAIKGHSLNIIFEKLSPKSNLQIMESPKPANLHIMPGKYQSVYVRGQTGYLVKGTWVKGSSGTSWQDSISLWLMFNIEDWIVMLNGTPAKAWSEEELIKIAESMKEYEG